MHHDVNNASFRPISQGVKNKVRNTNSGFDYSRICGTLVSNMNESCMKSKTSIRSDGELCFPNFMNVAPQSQNYNRLYKSPLPLKKGG